MERTTKHHSALSTNKPRCGAHGFTSVGTASRAAHQRAARQRAAHRPPRLGGPTAIRGFTLVELLVVIAIIGILVAMLLPAIQAAREAARRSQCQNHLKQLAIGFLNYESTHDFYPSGGWGWRWSGDPDLGAGEKQPGGWGFQILPYLEEEGLHIVGQGLAPAQKKAELARQKAQPVTVFYCPSRRPPIPTFGDEDSWNADLPPGGYVGKLDYAANGGTNHPGVSGTPGWSTGACSGSGNGSRCIVVCPTTYPQGCDFGSFEDEAVVRKSFNGPVIPRFPIEARQVTDGTSKTIMVGEKYLWDRHYGIEDTINCCIDNNSAYAGYDRDTIRYAKNTNDNTGNTFRPTHDSVFPNPSGTVSSQGSGCARRFGSAHSSVFQVAMCDGSVHVIEFEIDLCILEQMANRKDGGFCSTP